MNKLTLCGNLTKEVELVEVNGHKIGKFGIAINRRFGKDEVDFFDCVVWDKQAEVVKQYCSKGTKVLLNGRIENRKYQGQDGTTRYKIEVQVEEIEFFNFKGNNEPNEKPIQQAPQQQSMIMEEVPQEDLPF